MGAPAPCASVQFTYTWRPGEEVTSRLRRAARRERVDIATAFSQDGRVITVTAEAPQAVLQRVVHLATGGG